jgi:SAM-dependent methyltransferase
MNMTKETIRDIFHWDIAIWAKAIPIWNEGIQLGSPRKKGLEIGANRGGCSLFLGLQGISVVCSDIENPLRLANPYHQKYGVDKLIIYDTVNAIDIKYPDDYFDVVVFKSVLGYFPNLIKQQKMINEIHRVLKKDGILLFAENCKGSILHQIARKWFKSWGKNWRYVSYDEMDILLMAFSKKKLDAVGFSALFVPQPHMINSIFAFFDNLFIFLPKKWRYVIIGYAIK